MSSPATKELRDLLGSYRFFAEMQRLATQAGQGDQEAVDVLDSMLAECSADPDWRVKNRWCSAALRALVTAGTAEAFEKVLHYVRNLPEDTPYGMIELLGGLLPAFGSAVLPPVKELVEQGNAATRAVAVQMLCHLSLEGSLPDEYGDYLRGLPTKMVTDRYLTHDLVELVLQQAAPGSMSESDAELDALLDDVIVEKGD